MNKILSTILPFSLFILFSCSDSKTNISNLVKYCKKVSILLESDYDIYDNRTGDIKCDILNFSLDEKELYSILIYDYLLHNKPTELKFEECINKCIEKNTDCVVTCNNKLNRKLFPGD